MKRPVLVLIALSVLSYAQAQSTYIGLRLSGASSLDTSAEFLPYLGLQLGILVAEPLEFRVAFDTLILASSAHADLLYTGPLGAEVRGYVGGGPDYNSNVFNGEPNFGVHMTAGLEYRSGSTGFFAEAQPVYAFSASALRVRLAVGFNFHYPW